MEYPITDWQTVTDEQMIDIAQHEAYHSFRSTIEIHAVPTIKTQGHKTYNIGQNVAINEDNRPDVEFAAHWLEKMGLLDRLGGGLVIIYDRPYQSTGAAA